LNSGSPIDEEKYKNYRRLNKQIADETEKAYFKHVHVSYVQLQMSGTAK